MLFISYINYEAEGDADSDHCILFTSYINNVAEGDDVTDNYI